MAESTSLRRENESVQDDRQVLQTIAWYGDEGWDLIEEACAQVGRDPLRTVLGAIARELVTTSIGFYEFEQETLPYLKSGIRLSLGLPNDEDRAMVEAGAGDEP